ncbi:MAG: hypothetical protein V2A69_15955 [Pseudomonadota bacterium]
MAIALTKIAHKLHPDGNKLQGYYSAAITGTYPAGGYTINNAAFPSATNVFKTFDNINPMARGFVGGGVFWSAESITNTDTTNPTARLRAWGLGTGGVDFEEVGTGIALATTAYLEIDGIVAGGVVSTDN